MLYNHLLFDMNYGIFDCTIDTSRPSSWNPDLPRMNVRKSIGQYIEKKESEVPVYFCK